MSNKSNFSIEAAVANQSGAMEADTILKNGRSLKSQMSKGNKCCFLFFICVFFFGTFSASAQQSKLKIAVIDLTSTNNTEYASYDAGAYAMGVEMTGLLTTKLVLS